MSYSVKLQCASLDLESFNEFFSFDFQSWYKQCYDTAVSSLAEIDYAGGVRPREDRMHGALLVMAELLRCANANWERINRELEELIPAQASSVSAGNDLILELGSVAGPAIQANGRLTFEDDLRSGGLLCFTTQ
jgi:hypothetical protein